MPHAPSKNAIRVHAFAIECDTYAVFAMRAAKSGIRAPLCAIECDTYAIVAIRGAKNHIRSAFYINK